MTPVQAGVARRLVFGAIATVVVLALSWSVDGAVLSAALGAEARAFGFALTFYPTVVMLLVVLIHRAHCLIGF